MRTQTDIDIGFSMKLICKKYFGFNLDYVGYLDYDQAVWQSVKKRKPLLTEFPNSSLINNFEKHYQQTNQTQVKVCLNQKMEINLCTIF